MRSKKLPPEIQKRALVKQLFIDAAMTKDHIETPSMGEILREEFLEPLNITPYRLSKELKVSTSTVLDLLHDRRKITVEMALRLSKFFSTSHKFWLNLQNELDVREDAKNWKHSLRRYSLTVEALRLHSKG